jgi:hypothetical protein
VGYTIVEAVVGLTISALIYISILKVLGSDPEERHVIEVFKARASSMIKRRG